jgi:hypothetical protein
MLRQGSILISLIETLVHPVALKILLEKALSIPELIGIRVISVRAAATGSEVVELRKILAQRLFGNEELTSSTVRPCSV